MKIVSWDIGIKNLAYCILEESNNTEIPFKIYDWKIINLIENNNKCYGFINDNIVVKCDNNITHKYDILDKCYYSCNIHKNQYEKILKKNLNDINDINDEYECEILIKKTGLACKKKAISQYNNCYYCNTHCNYIKKKMNNSKIEKIKQNANKVPIEIIKLNMVNRLDELPQLLDVDRVIIENQPALKNPKMKAISDTLYTWFLIRGLIDKKNNSSINKVLFTSPSNKLKVDNNNTIKLLSNTKNDTEKYKLTKELAIQYCNQLIKNDEKNSIFFNNKKKKDDLADAFLQEVYYIKILFNL